MALRTEISGSQTTLLVLRFVRRLSHRFAQEEIECSAPGIAIQRVGLSIGVET